MTNYPANATEPVQHTNGPVIWTPTAYEIYFPLPAELDAVDNWGGRIYVYGATVEKDEDRWHLSGFDGGWRLYLMYSDRSGGGYTQHVHHGSLSCAMREAERMAALPPNEVRPYLADYQHHRTHNECWGIS